MTTLFTPGVLDVAFEHRTRPRNSKNGARFVRAADGLDYVAKVATKKEPLAPQSEYVAHWLALRCSLPAAVGQWLRFPDSGSLAFGYRYEVGAAQYTTMEADETDSAMEAAYPLLWRVCVLDVFVNNPDRHMDNLLFRRSQLDQRWTFIAIDWGMALWNSGFPSAPVEHVARAGVTASTIAFLRTMRMSDPKMTLDVVTRLQAIRPDAMRAHLDQMPPEMKRPQTEALAHWWGTQERLDRLQRVLELLS